MKQVKYVRVYHQNPNAAKAYVAKLILAAAKKFIQTEPVPEQMIMLIAEHENGFKQKLSINVPQTNCRGTIRRVVIQKMNKTLKENKVVDIIFLN